jgi:hypothetical protein
MGKTNGKIKNQRTLKFFFSSVLSIVLAFSIVLLTSSVLFLTFSRSDSIFSNCINNYQQQALDELNAEFETFADKTDLPKEVWVNSLAPEDTEIILNTIASNLQYHYTTTFAGDEDVYALIKSRFTDYVKANDLNVTEKQISQNASLAVDAVNEAFGGKATSSVAIFRWSQSTKIMYFVIISAILLVVSAVIIHFLNNGRHRKYNYLGMSLTVSGYLLLFAGLVIEKKNFIVDFNYSKNAIYNSAIADLLNYALLISMAIGALCLLSGVIMLAVNYSYFVKKKRERDEHRKNNADLRSEYMEQYFDNNNNSKDSFERSGFVKVTGKSEPTKINFK